MLKCLYFFLFASFPFLTVAQPIIESSNAPAPGFTGLYHGLQWFQLLENGPNSAWDLSAVLPGSTEEIQLVPPSTVPGASNFPMATVAAFANYAPPYHFFQVTDSEMRTLGRMDSQPVIFSDPLVTMIFPCTYGTTWTDDYALPGEQGTHTYIADGYGTLMGPEWILEDVLKVRREYVAVDTIIGGTSYLGLMVEDAFWHSTIPLALASAYWFRLYMNGQQVEEQRVGSILGELPTGIHDLLANGPQVRVWPNPSHGTVSMRIDRTGRFDVTCRDLSGKVLIEERRMVMADVEFTFSMDALASGFYVVQLAEANGPVVTVPVVKN